MSLLIKNLYKEFNGNVLFRDFSVELTESTLTCILGPSGCGKTTLLNILGQIMVPDRGTLMGFDHKLFSYIFQEPRLLPWKTVRENIRFVLSRDVSPDERDNQTDQLIRLVDLQGFADYYPFQLSGGMRQRVSIARAFACPSEIILMDEPLSGLDIALKKNMIRWFTQLWKTDRRTVIFVTHDVDEALMLGNEILVLSQPPARIVVHEHIEEPAGSRTLENPSYKKLKQTLHAALGHRE